MSPRLFAVPAAPATAGLPLVVTGALVSVPGGLAVEVVPDGAYVARQVHEVVRRLRADSSAMSLLWSAVINPRDEATALRAEVALSAFLLDAQRLELTVEDADALVDQLGDAAQAARTTDPVEVDAWAGV